MSTTQNRRSSFSSSTSSSLAKRSSEFVSKVTAVQSHSAKKRPPSFSSSTSSSLPKRLTENNVGKVTAVQSRLVKKRTPLTDIGNLKNGTQNGGKKSFTGSAKLVPCATKIAKAKKGSSTSTQSTSVSEKAMPTSSDVIASAVLPSTNAFVPRTSEPLYRIPDIPDVFPCQFDDDLSVSMDESMSTCDSFKSPEIDYMDNDDGSVVNSLERKTFSSLHISENVEPAGNICNRDAIVDMEADDKIVNVDDNVMDPQLCATFACDIYKHLRASEAKKRPSIDFMEKIQKDISSSMRAILIDWLTEVSEEYRLVPDTLYLAVNYIDRYLSGNAMNRQQLQLLGVACMMIAAKYEEICAPQVEEFCYITDNTYFKEEVLQMESVVLNYLKFEMTAPTAKCFLRRFVRAAQGVNEVPCLQLESMANYVAELSLLEYSMLRYAPSLIAASAIFLAKYILLPSKRPWNSTLEHYTLYQPSDLHDCVKALYQLCCSSQSSNLPAIREKYSQHKYKFVAKKHCPPSIPSEFFQNLSN